MIEEIRLAAHFVIVNMWDDQCENVTLSNTESRLMTKTKDQSGSIFSREMTVTGEVQFAGTLIVDGKISGALSGNTMVVNSTGEVSGALEVDSLECFGTIEGTVVAGDIRISKTAAVVAEITAQTMEVEPGGTLNGGVHVSAAGAHRNRKIPPSPVQKEGGAGVPKPDPGQPPLDDLSSETEADDSPVSEESMVLSLEAAILGGSHLIVVVSSESKICERISELLEQRLAPSGRVGRLEDPTGSFGEVLIRIGSSLQIELMDYSDQQALIESIKAASQKDSGTTGNVVALMITEVERMYPATTERLLQQLVFPQDSDWDGVPVVLFGSPEVKTMIEKEAQNLENFEPDCIFEL